MHQRVVPGSPRFAQRRPLPAGPSRPARQPLESLERRLLFVATYDIEGVQVASLDQPQVYAIFRTSPNGNPLGGTAPDDGYSIKAFLDTGSSGTLISQETATALGIGRERYNDQPVIFSDVGVAGTEDFEVSTPVYVSMAPVRSLGEGTGTGEGDGLPIEIFNQTFGPARVQINPHEADPVIGAFDIIGMPAMAGKVMVLDPRPLNETDLTLVDSMRTYLYNRGTPFNAAAHDSDPGIPATNLHVRMSYGNFGPFTSTSPAGAPGPVLADNPFIGSDPTGASGQVAQGVTVAWGGRQVTGNFLFDSGAAASFMSSAIAERLGVYVTYPDPEHPDEPVLVDANGNPLRDQYTLPIGGIGGTINAPGFRLSSLNLPTIEGTPIRFLDAPVAILDVAVQNPTTGQTITLDGDFGMNFLVASVDINGTTLGGSAAGAFEWITFDQTTGVLGLQLPDGPLIVQGSTFDYARPTQTLTYTFSQNVSASLSVADLTVRNVATNQTVAATLLGYDPAMNTAVFSFNGTLPDGNYRATLSGAGVTNASGASLGANQVLNFFSLRGDANRDRRVDSSDFSLLASNFGRTDRTWARGDFNADGRVDSADFSILASQFGKTIPAPAARTATLTTSSQLRQVSTPQTTSSPAPARSTPSRPQPQQQQRAATGSGTSSSARNSGSATANGRNKSGRNQAATAPAQDRGNAQQRRPTNTPADNRPRKR